MVVQDISAFLPPGYKLKKEDVTTENSLLRDILSKSKVDISSLLPPDYSKKNNDENSSVRNDVTSTTTSTTARSINFPSEKSPPVKSIQDLFSKSTFDISSLLPRDYDQKKKNQTSEVKSVEAPKESSTESNVSIGTEEASTTQKAGGLKIVFPSRPGGRKPIYKITTPQSPRSEAPGAVTPKIQKGWPTR